MSWDKPIRPVEDPISFPFGAEYSPETVAKYGMKHSDHRGVDFACKIGTKAKAVVDGIVYHTGWDEGGWGNNLIIKNGRDYYIYCHLSGFLAKEGQQVKQGDYIVTTGNTSTSKQNTEEHLHIEHHRDDLSPNGVVPLVFFDPNKPKLGGYALLESDYVYLRSQGYNV